MKNIGLPKTIDIGWRTLKVQEWIQGSKDNGIRGLCDVGKGVISIDLEDDYETIVNTFLHEILHGIYSTYSLESEADEEKTVETLANGLIEVFKRNPALIKVLSKL